MKSPFKKKGKRIFPSIKAMIFLTLKKLFKAKNFRIKKLFERRKMFLKIKKK